MEGISRISGVLVFLLVAFVVQVVKAAPAPYSYKCPLPFRCADKTITCPKECPTGVPEKPKHKGCYLDCNAPTCEAVCKYRKPNCDGFGSGCYDPRFIGADGSVFYFHGESNQNFALVSDSDLQINARFIGHRPSGRSRDFTWIQALGVLFKSHSFSVEAIKASEWDDEIDHLKFSYDGQEILLPVGPLSTWYSADKKIKMERISSKNSIVVSIQDVVEIAINAVPITKEDSKIHNYQIPAGDCMSHLEVQFRFYGLSPKVEGVLGRTYQPDFVNPAKLGVAMPIVGGEDKYRTSSILTPDCKVCVFSNDEIVEKESLISMEYGTLDCTGKFSRGNGIVCKK